MALKVCFILFVHQQDVGVYTLHLLNAIMRMMDLTVP